MADDEKTGRIFCTGSLCLSITILIFGMGAVSLAVYSHLYSIYTMRNPYPAYKTYFYVWELKKSDPRVCGFLLDQSLAYDAKDVIDALPTNMGNGHESCKEFKAFLYKLAQELETGSDQLKARLKKEKVEGLIHCPRVIHERIFVGIVIICCALSLLCFTLTCLCDRRLSTIGMDPCIVGSFHIICGLGLLSGIGFGSYFLYELMQTCSSEVIWSIQFLEGIEKFQIHFCMKNFASFSPSFNPGNIPPGFDPANITIPTGNFSIPSGFNPENISISPGSNPGNIPEKLGRRLEMKVEDINEKLLPRVFGYNHFNKRSTSAKRDDKVMRNKAKTRALRNRRDVGEEENEANEQGVVAAAAKEEEVPRRRRKFSWSKKVYKDPEDEFLNEGSSVQGTYGDNKVFWKKVLQAKPSVEAECNSELKNYWKILTLAVAGITALLYLCAGMNVLCCRTKNTGEKDIINSVGPSGDNENEDR